MKTNPQQKLPKQSNRVHFWDITLLEGCSPLLLRDIFRTNSLLLFLNDPTVFSIENHVEENLGTDPISKWFWEEMKTEGEWNGSTGIYKRNALFLLLVCSLFYPLLWFLSLPFSKKCDINCGSNTKYVYIYISLKLLISNI